MTTPKCCDLCWLRTRLAAVEAERDEAIELAEEVIPYAGEYFDEKWALTERLNELKLRVAARGEGDRPAPSSIVRLTGFQTQLDAARGEDK